MLPIPWSRWWTTVVSPFGGRRRADWWPDGGWWPSVGADAQARSVDRCIGGPPGAVAPVSRCSKHGRDCPAAMARGQQLYVERLFTTAECVVASIVCSYPWLRG